MGGCVENETCAICFSMDISGGAIFAGQTIKEASGIKLALKIVKGMPFISKCFQGGQRATTIRRPL